MSNKNINRTINLKKRSKISVSEYADYFENLNWKDRKMLSKCLTLVETEHLQYDPELLRIIAGLPSNKSCLRIGITGPPGVGKSSFIECLGNLLVSKANTLSVLAVDPSSSLTKGSILGDKTRMENLSRHPKAFIRPSANALSDGGIRNSTIYSMAVCEASGFDYILVETVGVGQSESHIRQMVDLMILLLNPAGGDDLQAIKKGNLELADIIVVNKADGHLREAAQNKIAEIKSAKHAPFSKDTNHESYFFMTSALENKGFEEIVSLLMEFRKQENLSQLRANQSYTFGKDWLQKQIKEIIWHTLQKSQPFKKELEAVIKSHQEGDINIFYALSSMSKFIEDLIKKSL